MIIEWRGTVAAVRNFVALSGTVTRIPACRGGQEGFLGFPTLGTVTDLARAAARTARRVGSSRSPGSPPTTAGRERFDDVLGRQWTIPASAPPPRRSELSRCPIIETGRDVDDHTGALTAWLRGKNATAAVSPSDGFIYAAADSGQPPSARPQDLEHPEIARNGVPRMSSTGTLSEHTVTVDGRPIFYAEAGTGPAVVLRTAAAPAPPA